MARFQEVVEPSGHGVRVLGQLSSQPDVLGLPMVCSYCDSHKPPGSSSLPWPDELDPLNCELKQNFLYIVSVRFSLTKRRLKKKIAKWLESLPC